MSGLRSLYVLISESMGELEYLQVNIHSPLSFFKVYWAIFYLPFDIEYLYFIYFLLLCCFRTNKSFRFTSPIVKIRPMLVVIGGIGYLLLTNILHYQLPHCKCEWSMPEQIHILLYDLTAPLTSIGNLLCSLPLVSCWAL